MATAFGGEPLGNVFMPALFESRAGYPRRGRREREHDDSFTPKPSLLQRLHLVSSKPAIVPKSPTTSVSRGRQRDQDPISTAASSRSSSRVSWRSIPFLRRRSSNSTMASVESRDSSASVVRTTTRDARARARMNRLSVVEEDAGPVQPADGLARMYQMGLFDASFV